jgi:hypothetical protein
MRNKDHRVRSDGGCEDDEGNEGNCKNCGVVERAELHENILVPNTKIAVYEEGYIYIYK